MSVLGGGRVSTTLTPPPSPSKARPVHIEKWLIYTYTYFKKADVMCTCNNWQKIESHTEKKEEGKKKEHKMEKIIQFKDYLKYWEFSHMWAKAFYIFLKCL